MDVALPKKTDKQSTVPTNESSTKKHVYKKILSTIGTWSNNKLYVELCLPKSYVEVLIIGVSECDLIQE